MLATGTPMKLHLKVPTLNDSPKDFEQMFELWRVVQHCESPMVIFDFSDCCFLRQNAVAFLGGLARLIEARDGFPHFAWQTMQDDIRMNLSQNGFTTAFSQATGGWQGNSIPYREDAEHDIIGIAGFLDEHWLGRDWVSVDSGLKDEIVSTMAELYDNAFTHGLSSIGVFTCGQRFPSLNALKLTIIDFGVGIPAKVRCYLDQPLLPAQSTMEWAFTAGNTTRREGGPAGIGLDTLKAFVKEKQGKIEIYSHDGYAIIDRNQERYATIGTFFEGTLINITVKCDPVSYTCL
jgi:hypothetical protein